MASKSSFAKIPLKSSDHLALLKARGMIFNAAEESSAYELLTYVGYFRLSGYCRPFQKSPSTAAQPHEFVAGTSFAQVANLYRFDEALRHLCGEALQRVEVALRTVVCNKLSLKHSDPHWFALPIFNQSTPNQIAASTELVSRIFKSLDFDPHSGQPINDRKEGLYPYIDNYYKKHTGPPPGWMLREVGSFGLWSKIFAQLSDSALRQVIANEFKYPDRTVIDEALLRGWTHSLSVFRNSCAHHHRLVARSMSFMPGTPASAKWAAIVPPNSPNMRSVIGVIALIERNTITGSTWLPRLNTLFAAFENSVNIEKAIGFAGPWNQDPIWAIPP